jgi:hypothetical protein
MMVTLALCGSSIAQSAQGRRHLDQAIALFAPAEHRPLATRFGQDLGVTILSYRSRALWLFGYPEAALRDNDEALPGLCILLAGFARAT